MEAKTDAMRVLYGTCGPDGELSLDTTHTVLTLVPGWGDLGACSSMVSGPSGYTTITIPGTPVSPPPSASWDPTNDFSLMLLFPEGSSINVTDGTITYPAGKGFRMLDARQVEYHQTAVSASQL